MKVKIEGIVEGLKPLSRDEVRRFTWGTTDEVMISLCNHFNINVGENARLQTGEILDNCEGLT